MASRNKIRAPLPVILLIIAFLCPSEFSVYIAGLRFPPHRVALFLLFPLAIWRLVRQSGLKFKAYDLAFLAYNVWTTLIYIYHLGSDDGLVYGGSLALESLGSYLVARVWIRDAAQFQATLTAMAVAIAFAALVALPETLFGKIYTHDFLRELTGFIHPTGVEQRVGLTRAYGTFDHPIHYGTFCATFLALFWFAGTSTTTRNKRVLLIVGATCLGLSSAPILCLLVQAGLLVWERLTRGVKYRTSMTLAALFGLYIFASCVMTRSPIMFIATGLTLDAATGFYRTQIWENGLINVYDNALLGIGLKDWVRPEWMASSTIDAFWLVLMMRQGLVSFFLLGTGIFLIMRAVVVRGLGIKDLGVRRLARGWIMSMLALSLIATTVHLWNVPHAFFFFFIGTAGWLADPRRAKAAKKTQLPKTNAGFYVHTLAPAPVPALWPAGALPHGAS